MNNPTDTGTGRLCYAHGKLTSSHVIPSETTVISRLRPGPTCALTGGTG
jgi:hypothetical protein